MRESGFAVLHANINKNVESANCLPPKEVMGGGEEHGLEIICRFGWKLIQIQSAI